MPMGSIGMLFKYALCFSLVPLILNDHCKQTQKCKDSGVERFHKHLFKHGLESVCLQLGN